MVISSRTVDNPALVMEISAAATAAAAMVRGGLNRATAARDCWEWIRANTRYRQEGPEAQTLRMPWAFVRERVGDCKSQAIFTGALCAASGCAVVLRFVTMPGDTQPGHVYAMVNNLAADPLLEFGQECNYLSRLDVPLPTRRP